MDAGFSPTWLCQKPHERDRVVDMEARLRPVRTLTFGVLALSLLGSAPWIGAWTLIPLAVAGVGFWLADRGLEGSPRPELRIAAAWAISQFAIAGSIVLTGGIDSPALAWLAIPVVTLPARFSGRGVAAGLALTTVLMLAVTLGPDTGAVAGDPPHLLFPLVMVAAVATLSSALMRSDREHRAAATIDPLTGLLNRKALAARVEELRLQSARVERVSLVACDLDHFKRVNDTHGHARGDDVLRDVAYALRHALRSGDVVYRLGGEEFLALLPGASREAAIGVAERLRATVRELGDDDLPLSMSFGVATATGADFDFDLLLEAADAALYRAKREGRDRVVAAGEHHGLGAPAPVTAQAGA